MIAVLLSTYNGELYLRAQLDSLLAQTFQDFTIYIRDDGSKDATIEIIEEYRIMHSNIVVLPFDKSALGASGSFMKLLSVVDAEYYMLCDQDDIWLPKKIELCVSVMEMENVRSLNQAILLHTDLIVTDEDLNILNTSLWDNDKIDPCRIQRKFLKVVNYVTGCTMFFNRQARDVSLKKSHLAVMHDYWIALAVDSSGGKILSIPVASILYRQHSRNAVGASKRISRFPKLNRYFHMPNLSYSVRLFKMLQHHYSMSWYSYLWLRIEFFIKK